MTIANEHAFSGLQKMYDHARPRYPEPALNHIVSLLTKASGAEQGCLLDVGCGTGILTRQLQQMSPQSKCSACDINEDMLSEAKAKDTSGTVSWHQSPAEKLPFKDGAFHIITVGQAAQWFDRPSFYSEARRVLTPNGYLVIIENNRLLEDSAFMDAYETLIETHNSSYSRNYRQFDYAQEMKQAGFAETNLQRFPWSRSMSRDSFIEMAKSSSKVQAAIKASNGRFLAELNEILHNHWPADEPIVIDYVTQAISAHE